MVTASTILDVLLNGLTIGMVFVLVAAGLSIVFGVMDVLNVAHGELFALGAYLGFSVIAATEPAGLWLALALAPIAVGLAGAMIERFTIRPIYDRGHLSHVLLTFGFLLILFDLKILVWGRESKFFSPPALIDGPVTILGYGYPAYNYFMIISGIVLAVGTWGALNYTTAGLIVRAGGQDRGMVRNLGIDIDRYYTLVFGLGAALAGFAGVVLGGYQNVSLGMGNSVIIAAFVIVVLGGLGSFRGAVVGGLVVGLIQSFVATFFPVLQGLVIFLVMVGVLLVRPHGLFGTAAAETGGSSESNVLKGTTSGFIGDRLRSRLGLLTLVVLFLIPLGVGQLYSDFVVTLLIEILIWGLFALGYNLLLGYTGLISFGHALFYGAGIYTVILVFIHLTPSVFVAIALAVLVAGVLAAIVGHLSIRVSGVYFVMITLAFAQVVFTSVFKVDFLGGSNGLFISTDPLWGIAGTGVRLDEIAVGVPGLRVTGEGLFYYLLLLIVVGTYLVSRRLIGSPFGSVLQAIRESETRSRFIGYDVQSLKRQSFVISGVVSGLAGALFAVHNTFAAPAVLHWFRSGDVLLMAVLGGVGTLYGPMIGAGVFIVAESYLSSLVVWWRLILGLFFVLVVLFLPKGLVSLPAVLASYLGRTGPPFGAVDVDLAEADDSEVKR